MKYNENAQDGGENVLLDFLNQKTAGNDVLYASSAVEAFRYYGVPARYVEGYYLKEKAIGANGNATLTSKDGHAWVEVYFDGLGWLPIDVTPGYYDDVYTLMNMVAMPQGDNSQVNIEKGHDDSQGLDDGQNSGLIQIKLYPKNITNPGISHLSCITFEDKNGFKVCKDANGTLYEDAQGLLGMKSSYVLRVNKSTNVVTVLAANGTGDYNIAYKRFVCSTGNDTPYGTYHTLAKYRWKELMGPSYGQYSTRIVGGILFHSVPYSKQNPYTLSAKAFNQLGTTCSHGCVRLMCCDAKWIYDN